MAVMAIRWTGVTIDCADPARLAAFWGAVLGREATDEMEGEGWATIGSRYDAHPRLTFQRVPEPRLGKVRLHLDLEVDDLEAAMVEIERLGGSRTGERHEYDEGVVALMADPEGHEFCVTHLF